MNQEQNNNSQRCYVEESFEDSENEEDEEQEYAYQCDFKKRAPPHAPRRSTSLLSNLLSNSSTPVPIQSCTKSDRGNSYPPVKPIHIIGKASTNKPTTTDPLSESLKKNVEWEHAQSPLEKYKNSKKYHTSSESLNDNFSRW